MKALEDIHEIIELRNSYQDYLPKHIGLILDGNRRWIKRQGIKDTLKGHMAGYEALKKILTPLFDVGVKYLSIYALSSENIQKRSPKEVKYLYNLFLKGVQEVLKDPAIDEKDAKVTIIGRIHELPPKIQEGIKKVNQKTQHHTSRFVNVCINYDGQLEIVDAVKSILKDHPEVEKLDKQMLKDHLYTHDSPELDYIIRTGMDDGARISGFLLWDASYAEFRFRNELWPDYSEKMLLEDLKIYIKRNRRKGA